MSASHLALLRSFREHIQQVLSAAAYVHGRDPCDVLIIVADLRGEFGQAWGEVLGPRGFVEQVDGFSAVRRSDSFCAFVPYERGFNLIAQVGPSLVPELLARPHGTVPMLVVDHEDVPHVVYGRLVSPTAS